LPFDVYPVGQIGKKIGAYTHAVIDTEANPGPDDFKELADGCDLLIIPAEPETTATDGLYYTLKELIKAGKRSSYRVLLTKVLPKPRDIEADKLRAALEAESIPVFQSQIPFLGAFHKASTEGGIVSQLKEDRNAKRAWASYEAAGREFITSPALKAVANG
jgi:chromosome partitioning protein